MPETAPPTHTNRLINETSPYLLQHAHNPVDWYPWGEEALGRAKQEDRLILLSIGYSACHWCHVMERESFEDEPIAALMNEHFVNIKVDREERPDLDDIYMAATVAMNQGQGGWPMTVFLTPNLEPVFAGTYFPPTDAYGRPGFATLLERIAGAWNDGRERLRERAGRLVEQLRQQRSVGPSLAVGQEELELAGRQYADEFDPQYGGFGSAPKFPPATGLSLLLRVHRRYGDPHALVMVRKTLDAMANGGMYDQVGGGFARYSTDERWLVPHFEKMLYDNALLVRTYLEGFQATGDGFYRRIAIETLDYILREMTSPEGGFFSSTDADSEGVEGKFFVWTPEEIADVLGKADARLFNAYYDITPAGNWEGKSIPNAPRSAGEVAKEFDMELDDLEEKIRSLRAKVYEARSARVKPGLDDKILTSWNGLMIGAMAEGYRILDDTRYLEGATTAADFVLNTLALDDGRLLRTYRSGKAHLAAYLEDYAYLADGLIDLYEAGGDPRYLDEAAKLMERVLADFGNGDGAFFNTAKNHEALIMRYREGSDGATPSANAVAASALVRLSYHLDRHDYRGKAAEAIKTYGRAIARFPRGFARSLIVVDFLLEGPVELALVGARESADLAALRREIAKHFLPNRIEAVYDPASPNGSADLPLLKGKTSVDGKATLYICRDFACRAPVVDPGEAGKVLEEWEAGREVQSTIAHRLSGRATPGGTARFAERFEAKGYRALGATDLTTSLLGFGAYRVDDTTSEHREALTRALLAGVNLIDTSTNYMDGGSERLVGSVVREFVDNGEIARDEVIVVSKVGYVQGSNLELAREREKRGDGFPEMVKIEDDLWHNIHPKFLEDQLARLLDRLELETIDVCLLHNPEYFLSSAAQQFAKLEDARNEFYERLERAFGYLESAVDEERLGCYGVSSNTSVSPATDVDATSLTRMLEAARKAAGKRDHHFRVLQLPLNLFEAGAVFEKNGGGDNDKTVLEVAEQNQVAVLANRPLNALAGAFMLRLAEVVVEADPIDLDSQIARVGELEDTFRREVATLISVAPGSVEPADFFRWAEQLKAVASQIKSLEQWTGIESNVNYRVGRTAIALQYNLSGEALAQWADWRDRYFTELDKLLREMRRRASKLALERTAAVRRAISPAIPNERNEESLSRLALWTVASTPGVTCTLNGMRRVQYVEDALGIMEWPPVPDATAVYTAVKGVDIDKR